MRTAIVSTLVALSLTETRGQPTLPVWQTWSSNIASTAKIPNKLPQHRKGFGAYQVDTTRNMSAWIGDGQDYVADFNKQIVAFTECTAKDGCRCQYTCKLMEETACQSQLDGNALCGYDYEHRSKFVANVSVDGVETMHFHFADPLGPIPMAAHDVYVSLDGSSVVQYEANFHPFLKEVALITSVYTNFSSSPPPASIWEYSNAQYCPDQSDQPQCQNTMKLMGLRGHTL
eukprot:m.437179 g.437179  ORF g.437179 m.437179 type:complete len:230 (+) comp18077_c0_seq1:35-724(+)